MAFSAFLDTCALYPAYLCDTLLRLAEADAYRPLWSKDVLDELRRSLVGRGIQPDKVDHRLREMCRAFPDAMVTGYESLVDGMANHPKDRHVLSIVHLGSQNANALPRIQGPVITLDTHRSRHGRHSHRRP